MDVIASVIVAALVNWNDTVEVTGPLDAQDSIASEDLGTSIAFGGAWRCARAAGLDHDQGVVPVHERGHDHGKDHVHGRRPHTTLASCSRTCDQSSDGYVHVDVRAT